MDIQSYIELCKNKRIECMKKSTKMEFLHSAIIFNHKNFNKIINYGENKQRLTYCHSSIHAEESSILKLKPLNNSRNRLKNIDILVLRVSKGGYSLGNSKPCLHCINTMNNLAKKKGYNVKDIYYSCSNNTIIKTTLTKLINDPNIHISKFYRRHIG
jgi:cytidine deaminase